MSKRVRGWRRGDDASAGRPAEPAGQFARRDRALDRRSDGADHHECRDDAGADDLRPRHREAVVSLDRLAVPIEPAVAVDRQPAEIGHVDRVAVAALRLGLGWAPARRSRPIPAAADRRRCRPNRWRANRRCESAARLRLRSRISVALARVDEGREETHRAPCFPARQPEVKAREGRGRVPRWTTGRAIESIR